VFQLDAGNLRSGVAQRGKIDGGILIAAKHHANRKRDLRVENVLALHGFGESAGNQGVVFRTSQERSDPDEIFDELVESARGVTRSALLGSESDSVARG